MLDDTWLCQQSLSGQADCILFSLHPPFDLFSLFHSLEMKNIKVKKSQRFHYFIPSSLSLGNLVQPWIITTPIWSLVFRKCNLVLVLRISNKVQLLKLFLMLFSVLYKLLEYTFVFLMDLVTSHYLVVTEFWFLHKMCGRIPWHEPWLCKQLGLEHQC